MLKKMWVAIGGALAMLAHGLLTDDGSMSAYDWVTLAIQGGTVVLVWWVENGPKGTANYALKATVAAWTAAGAVFLPAFADGMLTGEEWGKTGVAAVTALLVLLIPNRESGIERATPPPAAPAF